MRHVGIKDARGCAARQETGKKVRFKKLDKYTLAGGYSESNKETNFAKIKDAHATLHKSRQRRKVGNVLAKYPTLERLPHRQSQRHKHETIER